MSATGQATSRDGRTFTFAPGGTTPLLPGSLVVLHTPDDGSFLGQVLEQASGTGRDASGEGSGLLLGELGEDGAPQRNRRRPPAAAHSRVPGAAASTCFWSLMSVASRALRSTSYS